MSFSLILECSIFYISCNWTIEFVETKRDGRHGKNSIGSLTGIFVDLEDFIGLIESSRETGGRDTEETGR
jgi:hypothetical protein